MEILMQFLHNLREPPVNPEPAAGHPPGTASSPFALLMALLRASGEPGEAAAADALHLEPAPETDASSAETPGDTGAWTIAPPQMPAALIVGSPGAPGGQEPAAAEALAAKAAVQPGGAVADLAVAQAPGASKPVQELAKALISNVEPDGPPPGKLPALILKQAEMRAGTESGRNEPGLRGTAAAEEPPLPGQAAGQASANGIPAGRGTPALGTAHPVDGALDPASPMRAADAELPTPSLGPGEDTQTRLSGTIEKLDAKSPALERAAPIAETVVRSVRLLASDGGRTLTVRLVPASLGELRVEISATRDGVAVHLAAATETAREALLVQANSIREALAQQGIEVNRFAITSNGPGGESGLGGHRQTPLHGDAPAQGRTLGDQSAPGTGNDPESTHRPARWTWRDGTLDVRV